ncbi:MAG: DNA repair protein RadA [Rhodospirillaceae bacterium]
MVRAKSVFVCQDCGASHSKWAGQCDGCGAWNTLVEEQSAESAPKGLSGGKGKKIQFVGLIGEEKRPPRFQTGIAEFNRVCGGGLVPGSAMLVGGDPGIGKSTLLLQATASLAKSRDNLRAVYISGEEAVDQVRMRAERLGLADAPVELASATSVRDIVATLDEAQPPHVVVADSIQTLYVDNLDSAPGTVAQVRTSAQELIRLAKRRGFTLFLVGHVTKEGAIAGPKVLEHMVDTVLYFEGERGHQFRILRAVKNRFGPADEIGVFEMMDTGLAEVANPSALFLGDRDGEFSGASVFAGIEGSRPMLVEIQALTAPTSFGTPRRAVVGWDSGRLNMILAVLEARSDLSVGANDVYLNVAGGLRISEPAADLAVAAALISSMSGTPVPQDTIVFGEVGLSGEVRPVSQSDARLKEASKLGFSQAIMPKTKRKGGRSAPKADGITVKEIEHLNELVGLLRPVKAAPPSVVAGG